MSTKFRERFQNVQRRPNFQWTHSVQMPVYHCVSQVWGIKNWYRLWDVGLVLVPIFSFQFAALYVCSRFYYSVFCHCSLKTFAKFYWQLCCCLLTGDAGRAGRGWHSWTNSPKLESKHHIADNVVYLFGCRNMYDGQWSPVKDSVATHGLSAALLCDHLLIKEWAWQSLPHLLMVEQN